ncbi:MAG: peptidoglycan DD-metalloendopeptidase family protein [Acidobacteriota bacterium]
MRGSRWEEKQNNTAQGNKALPYLLIALSIVIYSCAHPARPRGPAAAGVYHIVTRGLTLWRIARAYGVDLEKLAEVNGIEDPTLIKTGQRLFIPGATRVLEIEPYQLPIVLTARFIWPVKGRVTSSYGYRRGELHTGIDIAAPRGEKVVAARDGVVIYTGKGFSGYGNMVIIEHKDNTVTLYAHNASNLVKTNQRVQQGELIAKVGSSGRASGAHLHFEIRVGNNPVNPLLYLTDAKK